MKNYNKLNKAQISSGTAAIILVVVVIILAAVLIIKFDLIHKLDIFIPSLNDSKSSSSDNPPIDTSKDKQVLGEQGIRSKLLSNDIKIDPNKPCNGVQAPDCFDLAGLSEKKIDKLIEFKNEFYGVVTITDYDLSTDMIYLLSDGEFAFNALKAGGITSLSDVKTDYFYNIQGSYFKLISLEKDDGGIITKAKWGVFIKGD